MGNDEKTINRLVSERYGSSFSEFLHKRFEDGNFKLLAKQFEMAVGTEPRVVNKVLVPGRSPNKTMLIWLGKQRLDQVNAPEPEESDPVSSGEFVISLKKKAG